MPTRRDFLTTVGVALGAASLGSVRALEAMPASAKLPKIGIQLYTVRSLMAKDVEGTLARLAGIGYREVEFAGYFDRTPAQIRAILAENHLASPSTHFSLPATDDAWKKSLDEAKAIGHEWAVLAWLDPSVRKSPDDWKGIAARLNQLGTMARSAGLRFAYHNHDFEFMKVDAGTGLDTLIGGTDPKLVDFEMDIYWVTKGGGDPLDLIARYPHRFPLMHAKDASPAPARAIVDVGSGTIDFAKIFARQESSGMRHVYVENDSPADAIQSATNSYRYLAALRF